MLTFSNFDRSTLKLLVAAFFVLGGASVATAHAQDVTCTPDTCPPVYIGSRSETDSAPLPVSISQWNSGFAAPGFTYGVGAQPATNWANLVGDLPSPQSPVEAFHFLRDDGGGHWVEPTTTAFVVYSKSHRKVEISGIVMAQGMPRPHAKIYVDVVLDGEFLNSQTVTTDEKGAYSSTLQAPARIVSVRVRPESFCSGYEPDCFPSSSSGEGDSADSGTPVGSPNAVHVAVAGQPDAMAACTNPKNAAAPGLGLAGVAVSNATPAADTTSNVDQAVDAYNLF